MWYINIVDPRWLLRLLSLPKQPKPKRKSSVDEHTEAKTEIREAMPIILVASTALEIREGIPNLLVASTGSATAMLPPLCFMRFNMAEMVAVFP